MDTNPINILIVCEHASNKFGGEAMLPLNYFRFLNGTKNKPYLLTHERVKKDLEALDGLDQSAIFYIPDTQLHKLIFKTSKFLPDRIYTRTFGALLHIVTQFYQRQFAKKLITQLSIDVIHEPAPVSATQPSAMYGMNIPVLIGPLNGGMTFPPAFSELSGKFEKYTYFFTSLFDNLFNRVLPGKRHADLILVANERTQQALPSSINAPVELLVENGSFSIKSKKTIRSNDEPLNILYVGRLVDWKCVNLAIEAASKCSSNIKLTIVGDGPERKALESLADERNLKNIYFAGLVPHSEVNTYYESADIFILPSVRECGGAVVLEAMSRGVPVIAVDWGGPADYITKDTGYLVTPSSKEYLINEFSRLIDVLSKDQDLRSQMGRAAVNRVEENFLWGKKIDQIISHYNNII